MAMLILMAMLTMAMAHYGHAHTDGATRARRVQAALVSEELIRTSILWHEMWHAALEEASRLYFSQDDYTHLLLPLLLGL